ncbi:MAG: hypothetical protein ACNA78_08620 [Balneolaceae bacterium]
MNQDGFDQDPIWNEFQWEAHLNEIEKRSEQLRRFITSDPKRDTPRWITLLEESLDEMDAVEAFIEEELLLDDAYFPDDDDDWEDDEDEFDDDFFFSDDELPFLDDDDDDDDDFDYGEEWKELSDDFTYSDYGNIENLAVYRDAIQLAVDVLKWGESIPHNLQHRHVHDFVSNVLKIGAKLAGGYSFGFEQDVMGANIAYTKKALHSANEGLLSLAKIKDEPFLTPTLYYGFHSRLFEIRNDIGVYVQELRDRFQFGIE